MRPGAAFSAVLLAALLGACGPAPAPPAPLTGASPADGGRFVYPLRSEPTTLNFVTGTDQFSQYVTHLVGDGLVDFDTDLRIVPRLASSWEWSPDGRQLTFYLRPGVRFHDGVPCTSRDVLFTYERIIDPHSRAVGRIDGFLPIDWVETPDELTVRVRYRVPYAPALQAWEVPILPRHLYARGDGSALDRAPVGTGPFRFVSWEPGRRITLRANEDYWGGRPHLDTLRFEIIPSQETALQALLAGEADFATLTPVQWDAQQGRSAFRRDFATLRYVPLFLYYIAWRCDGSNPFFADAAVRRALSLALDRQGYVRSVLRGQGEAAASPYRTTAGAADPEDAALRYDPGEAAALLERAGWRLDPHTGLRARHGVPFRFSLLIFGGGEDHVQFSQVAQEALRRLGVEMTIERLDWPSLWARLQSGRFQAALSGMALQPDPDWSYAMLHSSQIDGGQNYAAFRDAEVDQWLDEARRTLDAEQRLRLYRQIDRRLAQQQPYSFLFYPLVRAGVARRMGGIRACPRGILGWYPGAAAFYDREAGR
jgi:peptide/nickel transport system substrate-binding protein